MLVRMPFSTQVAGGGGITPTTWNPSDKSSSLTLSGGNLTIAANTSGTHNGFSVAGVSSGKYYFELTIDSMSAGDSAYWGIAGSAELTSTNGKGDSGFWLVNNQGTEYNGSAGSSYTAFTSTDICMIAVDMDNSKIWFGRNGTWHNSGNPAAGTNAAYTNLTGTVEAVAGMDAGSTKTWQLTANFGASAFSYTVPSGFNSGFGN